ncbi:MAG TPA: calcineurin-like phosphoesterase family protein [Abditibacterium sp.]|jgi:hypothetical protein
MNRREFTRNFLLTAGALTLQPLSTLVAQQTVTVPASQDGATTFAAGIIYGVRGGKKSPLPQVRVSNGRDIVVTDRLGRYRLPVAQGDVVFVIKPRGFALPLNEQNLPQFYRVHQPQGSLALKFAGVAPTGPLPTSLDWTLQAQEESDEFRVLLFGDPQSRNQEEVGFLTRDIIADVVGEKAAFGVSLGDLAFDDLSIYPNQNRAIAMLGMPWFNVVGNHDLNFDVPDRTLSTETFKSIFGPTYYSFDYGSAHFVVLDDVAYDGIGSALAGKNKGTYHTELGAKQLQWLENDLKLVPREQLVVIMTHIPLVNPEAKDAVGHQADLRDLAAFFRIIESRPHCISISAHTHFQQHLFLGREVGFNGPSPHHHFNAVTTCGSWWTGMRDEQGIPHTTMRDGAPNGYSFLNVKGNRYSIDFKAARRSADHQMNIYAPDEVASVDAAKTEILANIFAASEKSRVEMQIGNGAWRMMQFAPRPDPAYVAAKNAQEALEKNGGARKLPAIIDSPHIWAANLPENLPAGTHMIRVRTTDMWGRTHQDHTVIRVA